GAKQFFEKKTVSETTMIASAYWRMTSNQRPYRAGFFQKTVASSARLCYTHYRLTITINQSEKGQKIYDFE
ncbi:MAG: hypothetical protein IK954_08485, partial [Clostridia bacterium]|nr:hypothetical protein [Clostridia bacterium]